MTTEEFEKEHNCKECKYYFNDPYTPESKADCHWLPSEDEEERPCDKKEKTNGSR